VVLAPERVHSTGNETHANIKHAFCGNLAQKGTPSELTVMHNIDSPHNVSAQHVEHKLATVSVKLASILMHT
jgi:hypothetical protein